MVGRHKGYQGQVNSIKSLAFGSLTRYLNANIQIVIYLHPDEEHNKMPPQRKRHGDVKFFVNVSKNRGYMHNPVFGG